jgi:hypothetical protein
MDTPDFPSNSEQDKKGPDKDIQRVTTTDVVRKKKSLRKQFTEVFLAGTVKNATQYVVMDVMLPNARDFVSESVSSYIDKLIYGDRSRRRGANPPQSGPTGYVQYNRPTVSRPPWAPSSQRALSREARARHDFDEIVLNSRVEAEEVIDRLYDVVSRYESASVADLYELVGLSSTHTDHKWGWTDIRGAGVQRVRDGYLLDLPNPEPLD